MKLVRIIAYAVIIAVALGIAWNELRGRQHPANTPEEVRAGMLARKAELDRLNRL